ncbi:RND family efflux transporter MFP subunit [Methylopila capsulata]|uniref:Hemolysin secretion protein D n=1 Tax=Methylopila capsulata TaxID=61654 RepID=A0A9W6IUA1_9HYPH|nr:efflux RND transporter periplasmic adaptor subunit [Methylopila capsulata]MBM7852448.1 RND family efflux transporter MFP subunit [Methylopila capsulata]GLK56657.1 hemolysin secretion protein D [Methylopila capsulata]
MKRAIVLSAAAALLVAAATCELASAQDGQAAAALTVSTVKPFERRWAETAPASGWLKPWQEAIIASEASGVRITDVLVDVGSVVAKGQPVARLAQETVLADLRKQRAAIETAQANLAKAKANADRARRMRGSGALSEEKIADYLNIEQTAAASLKSEEAALESQQIKVDQTTITAPDDGFVTSRSAQLGTVVSPGTELFRFVRQSRVEWQAEVSARYLPRVERGLAASIAGPDGRRIAGEVRLVAPSVSADTGRAIVYVSLSGEDRPKIGLYATGEIELRTTDALTVPETALMFRDGLTYLFVLHPDRRVRRIRVEVGRRTGGEVEILSGLDRSADVVKSGAAFLSDNAVVKVEGEVP